MFFELFLFVYYDNIIIFGKTYFLKRANPNESYSESLKYYPIIGHWPWNLKGSRAKSYKSY